MPRKSSEAENLKKRKKMTWLIVIGVVALIGAIIGFFASKKGERGEGAATGAAAGAVGCGIILAQIFMWGIGIMLLILLFSWLFG